MPQSQSDVVDSTYQFSIRAHKALTDAWPLVQRGTIESVKRQVKAAIDSVPDGSRKSYLDLIFAIKEAWPYVHIGPGEAVSESRQALRDEFSQLLCDDHPTPGDHLTPAHRSIDRPKG